MDKNRLIDVVVEKSQEEEFDAKFIMSAATVDRVMDTIDPKAYKGVVAKTKRLLALFNHNPDKPIGYWSKLKAEADTLTGHIKFTTTSLGKVLKAFVDDGLPLGASIALRGKGQPNDQGGIHFTEIDVLECSIVSVPAHPRAVQIAKAIGINDLKAIVSDRKAEALSNAKKALERSKSLIPKGT